MNLLAVDTSTSTGGVALVLDDKVVAALAVTTKRTHAKRLMVGVDTVLRMARMHITQCDGYVVTLGPGSFTGLRIGISTIKGFGFATGKPIAGVSTLDVLAHPFSGIPQPVCPMIDARKEQVFTALYKHDEKKGWGVQVREAAVHPLVWLEHIHEPCLFVGDGAVAYRTLIEKQLGKRALFASPCQNTPRADVLAEIGLHRFKQGRVSDAAQIVPHYLRKSDAEIMREQLQKVDK